MNPHKRQFGRQLAKALGEGPGPRHVQAQKERLLAEAEQQRRAQRRTVAATLVIFAAALTAAIAYLLLR